jgi:hypothetical protein
LVDLLFRHSHPAEPSEPREDPVLQQVEEHYNLKMPSMWAEQAQRWSPEFRLTILLEVAVIKRNCQPLLDLGADQDVVVQAVFALGSDPFWRYALTVLRSVSPDLWVKTSVEIRKLAYMSHELEKWTSSPIFPELPPTRKLAFGGLAPTPQLSSKSSGSLSESSDNGLKLMIHCFVCWSEVNRPDVARGGPPSTWPPCSWFC